MSQSAFVLRIAPAGIDRIQVALASEQIIIGWAKAQGLLNEKLTWEEFREIVHSEYYAQEPSYRRAGAAAGHLWRFLRVMESGDLVIVPSSSDFYVAEVVGPTTYDPAFAEDGTAYRRTVRWLNGKKPIPRQIASSSMLSRMKVQGTSADASNLVDAVKSCLAHANSGTTPKFQNDLQHRLVEVALSELRDGRMESYGFERFICEVLRSLGSKDVRIIPRAKDEGGHISDVLSRRSFSASCRSSSETLAP